MGANCRIFITFEPLDGFSNFKKVNHSKFCQDFKSADPPTFQQLVTSVLQNKNNENVPELLFYKEMVTKMDH